MSDAGCDDVHDLDLFLLLLDSFKVGVISYGDHLTVRKVLES